MNEAPTISVRDAVLVVTGGLVVLVGVLVLVVFGPWDPDASVDLRYRSLAAWACSSIAELCFAMAFVRLFFAQSQLLSRSQTLGLAMAGAIGVFLSVAIPLGNIGLWLPTDPRSQPGNILATMLFPGTLAAAFGVVGVVLLVSRSYRRRSRGE